MCSVATDINVAGDVVHSTNRQGAHDLAIVSSDFRTYSMEDWMELPKEILLLHCGRLGLTSTGRKTMLAARLLSHFSKVPAPASGSSGVLPGAARTKINGDLITRRT